MATGSNRGVEIGIRINADGSNLVGVAELSQEALRDLRRELSRTDSSLRDSQNSGSSFVDSLFNMKTAAVAFAAALATEAVGAAFEFSSAIEKTTKKIGIGKTALHELGFIASQSGLDLDTLADALKEIQNRAADAAMGNQDISDAFKALGIDAERLLDLKLEDKFTVVAEALANLDDEAKRVFLAEELMGDAGSELIPVLLGGAEKMKELAYQSHELGVVLDEETTASVNRMAKSWESFKNVFVSGMTAIISYASPAVDWMSEVTRNVVDFFTGDDLSNSSIIKSFEKVDELTKQVSVSTKNLFLTLDQHKEKINEVTEARDKELGVTEDTISSYKKVVESLKQEIKNLSLDSKQIEINNNLRSAGNKLTKEQRSNIIELTKVIQTREKIQEEQNKAAKEWRENLEREEKKRIDLRKQIEKENKTREQFIEDLKFEIRLTKLNSVEKEIAIRLREAHAKGVYTEDEAIRQLIIDQHKLSEATQDASDNLANTEVTVFNFFQRIQGSFGDMFYKIFTDGTKGLKGFLKNGLDLFNQFTSDVAAQWAAEGLNSLFGSGSPSKDKGSKSGSSTSSLIGSDSPLGAAAMGYQFGGIGGDLIGQLIGDTGNQGKLGGSIGGAVGAAAGVLIPVIGPMLGGALGSILGGLIGSMFSSIKGSLRLRSSNTPTGFEHNNAAKVESIFCYIGVSGDSHDLEEVQKGLTGILTQRVKAFDESIGQFLSSEQIAKVTKGLQSTEALKIKIGQKLSDGEWSRVLADRAITILNSLDIVVPEILKQAMATEDFSSEQVMMETYKAILGNSEGLNTQLATLIKNFNGTFEKFKELANTVLLINQSLPSLTAVFGDQTDAREFVKAAQASGGAQKFNEQVSKFADRFGLNDEILASNLYESKQDLNNQLGSLNTSRSNFLRDFNEAKSKGLTAEDLKAWVEAGNAIIKVEDLEKKLSETRNSVVYDSFQDLMNAYDDQYNKVIELTNSYDGSAEATKNLAIATGKFGDTAKRIKDLIEATRKSVNSSVDDTIKSIQQSTMTDQELYNMYKSQAAQLQESLKTMSDPTKIKETVAKINELTGKAYALIPEEKKKMFQQFFIDFLTETKQIANERLDKTGQKLDQNQNTLAAKGAANSDLSSILPKFSSSVSEAATKNLQAADSFIQTINQMKDQVDRMNQAANNFLDAANTPISINLNSDISAVGT